jgi:hypothetical protein
MFKVLLLTISLSIFALPVRAQLHYPEYTEEQIVAAADKVCAGLNNGRTKTRFEATIMVKLIGSMLRDISGRENEYDSAEDKAQAIRNSNRVIIRLNRTCQAPLAD